MVAEMRDLLTTALGVLLGTLAHGRLVEGLAIVFAGQRPLRVPRLIVDRIHPFAVVTRESTST